MKNYLRSLLLSLCCFLSLTAFASAAEDTLKVGLNYGNSALSSANLQNEIGAGYVLGWFDENTRDFVDVGYLMDTKITMTVSGGHRVQLEQTFATFEEAEHAASQFDDGYVAYINNEYRVRIGNFGTREEAEMAAGTFTTYDWYDMYGTMYPFIGSAISPSGTVVTIVITNTSDTLFQFDCSGAKSLGILPNGGAEGTLTWFKGYKWYGGFEYRRSTGGNINVINVVPVDDYIKGVLPYEMSPSWPLEALKAQAVCARTYALMQTKHYKSYKFDVCNTTDCQVYYGANNANELTDQAAIETAGLVLTYGGALAEAYYYSSNGGASESPENVWTSTLPHLVGKEDPYEAMISIPNYAYTETFTFSQLTQLLQSKGYSIGTVNSANITRTTPTGNVAEITFTDTAGNALRITKERCRTVFSTSLFGKSQSVKSMRFTIAGGEGNNYFVNSASTGIAAVSGLYTISGTGIVTNYSGSDTYVITSSGTQPLEQKSTTNSEGSITIVGTGSGHNVGMSQYGAKSMAELGYTFEDILKFYYTGIELGRIGFTFENA